MEFLEEITKKMIGINNEIYPKLNCGYFNHEEEQQIKNNFEVLKALTQTNLDLIYPDRKNKTI